MQGDPGSGSKVWEALDREIGIARLGDTAMAVSPPKESPRSLVPPVGCRRGIMDSARIQTYCLTLQVIGNPQIRFDLCLR